MFVIESNSVLYDCFFNHRFIFSKSNRFFKNISDHMPDLYDDILRAAEFSLVSHQLVVTIVIHGARKLLRPGSFLNAVFLRFNVILR